MAAREEVSLMSGYSPSDFDPSLADNSAEVQASRDAEKESPSEKASNDADASESASSLWSSIFGKKE
jgi:hypothetical protein